MLASLGAVVSFFHFSLGVGLISMGLSAIVQIQMSQISDLKIMIHKIINEKFEVALQQLIQGKDVKNTDDSDPV